MHSLLRGAACLALAATVVGCNKTNSALPVSDNSQSGVVQQPLATGAPKISKITTKGGTKIAVLVNKTPITTNQIKRRVAFVRLRRMKGNARSIATNELIDEAIKMEEAKRIGAVANDAAVNAAYARFAKSNKMPVSALNTVLARQGVTSRGFKDFIRASMSWQRAVGARVQAEEAGSATTGVSKSPSWLPPAGQGSTKETEYTIQQIVFVVPASKRSTLLKRRRAEANSFRTRVNGCQNARTLAASLKDVTVLDRGRLLESKLPPRWAKQIKATPPGKVTRVQDDVKGVEMIAVCNRREVIGKSTASADAFSDGKFAEKASSTEKKYLKELKDRAIIVRR